MQHLVIFKSDLAISYYQHHSDELVQVIWKGKDAGILILNFT